MTYTASGARVALATSAEEPLHDLIEITHADLAVPARFINDTDNITFEGNVYYATRFRITKADDVDRQTPQARLAVDNLSRELTQFLELSNGGKGSRCRYIALLRSDLVPQFDMTLDLTGISVDNMEVSGGLGFQNTLMQPAVTVRYDPIRSPGLF